MIFHLTSNFYFSPNFQSFDVFICVQLNSVRGALSSLYDPLYNIGIILSYFMANYLNCLDQAKVQLIIPGIFVVILFFLPESPEFWIRKNVDKVLSYSSKGRVEIIN